jgi:hypothetical protein
MNLLSRKGNAKKKWRARARMIDLRKTRLVLASSEIVKRVPPWVYRKLVKSE